MTVRLHQLEGFFYTGLVGGYTGVGGKTILPGKALAKIDKGGATAQPIIGGGNRPAGHAGESDDTIEIALTARSRKPVEAPHDPVGKGGRAGAAARKCNNDGRVSGNFRRRRRRKNIGSR